jgi:hypothetical protein
MATKKEKDVITNLLNDVIMLKNANDYPDNPKVALDEVSTKFLIKCIYENADALWEHMHGYAKLGSNG